ncbi:MAG: transcriptional repressor [Flavobacteriales bacterium]|nr:transcriptional repressor [Flavobacteriales bacterium]
MNTAVELLKSNQLKVTKPRVLVLDHLMHCTQGHTLNELSEILATACDRVTVYRTLKTLEEKEIVHPIPDAGAMRFKLSTSCKHDFQHAHIHFRCEDCGEVLCIDEMPHIPALPVGYSLKKAEQMLKGQCAECATKSTDKT